MKVIITGAGQGTRLGMHMPKPLVKTCGKSILEWQMEILDSICEIEEVRLTVGYKGDKLADFASKLSDKIKIFVNEEYATTSCSTSVAIAGSGLDETTLILDGDVLITYKSVSSLLGKEFKVGVSSQRSFDNPVFATEENGFVKAFSREHGNLEWAGVAAFNPKLIIEGKYIYRSLEKHLPMKAQIIETFEIDVLEDLQMSEQWVQKYLITD